MLGEVHQATELEEKVPKTPEAPNPKPQTLNPKPQTPKILLNLAVLSVEGGKSVQILTFHRVPEEFSTENQNPKP